MSVMNGPFMSHTPAAVAPVDEEAGQPVVGQRRCGEFHLLAVEDAGQPVRGVAHNSANASQVRLVSGSIVYLPIALPSRCFVSSEELPPAFHGRAPLLEQGGGRLPRQGVGRRDQQRMELTRGHLGADRGDTGAGHIDELDVAPTSFGCRPLRPSCLDAAGVPAQS